MVFESKKIKKSFGWKEWLTFLPLLISYLVLGFYVIFLTNPLLAYCYIIYIVFFYIGVTSYLFCTKCPHYGERCSYIFAGVLAKRLFKKREGKCSQFERTYPAVALILLLAFPILFVLDKSLYLMIFIGIFILMFVVVKPYIVCATCKNVNCIAKPISNRLRSKGNE